jgi:hypothetical protein
VSSRNFNIALVIALLLSYFEFDSYTLSILLMILVIYQLLYKIGKGIIMMEIIIFISILTYLTVPIIGYEVYNETSAIARLWKKVMPIPKQRYYEYFLPCIICFSLGLNWFFGKGSNIDEGDDIKNLVSNIKAKLNNAGNTGIVLSSIGISFFFINRVAGGAFGYLGTLLYFTLYTGIMYIYFTPKSNVKYIMLGLDTAFVCYDAVSSGMFTMVAYMGATMFSIAFIGKKIGMFKKIIFFFAAICLIFFIQALKAVVRNNAAAANQFLVSDKATVSSIFTEDGFFPMYTRTSQGFITAAVLRRIPEAQDFDGGTSLITSISSSFVPRVFWPDKPKSGGIYNMQHFLGYKLTGYSMNIGPPGEAYGNFGVTGGIIFMFFFGLMIRFFYKTTIQLSIKNPLLILWLPITFFQVLYCMENDVLQAINSVLKGSLFIILLAKVMPSLFNIKEDK